MNTNYKEFIYEYLNIMEQDGILDNIPWIIKQSQYFSDVSNQLQQHIFDIFLDMYKNKEIQKHITMQQFFDKIDLNKIKKDVNFQNFLKVLINSGCQIIFKFNSENISYYEYLDEVLKYRVIDKTQQQKSLLTFSMNYHKYLDQHTNYCRDINQVYREIYNGLIQLTNIGVIGISINSFKKLDKAKIDICHQIGHFIRFLVRISNINYDFCRQWSRTKVKRYDIDKDIKNYYLDSQQFKALSQSYISYIINFLKNNVQITKENVISNLNFLFNKAKVNNIKQIQFSNIEIFNMFSYKSVINFIRVIYEDYVNNDSGRNLWKIFKKWLVNSIKYNFDIKLVIDKTNIFK